MSLAQTHLQLLRQARDAGYGKEDILVLRRDYETALRLFGHQMRYSGRPFVCHVIGSASAALHEGFSLTLVRAALNHAAYTSGRFPSGARGKRADHTRWLKDRVGLEVEALISDITDYPYSAQLIIEKSHADVNAFSAREREILNFEVCNDVDHGCDYGAAIEKSPNWPVEGYVDAIIRLSRNLGLPYCTQALEEIRGQLADSSWLTPERHFTFTSHRQSPIRYLKSAVIAAAKRLTGGDYHY